MRYINFFDFNIYEKSNLSILLEEDDLSYKKSNILIEFDEDNVRNVLRMSNNASIKQSFGSVIDIDTIYTGDLANFLSSPEDIISELHEKEKILFFSLLEYNYLQTLNPEY